MEYRSASVDPNKGTLFGRIRRATCGHEWDVHSPTSLSTGDTDSLLCFHIRIEKDRFFLPHGAEKEAFFAFFTFASFCFAFNLIAVNFQSLPLLSGGLPD